MIQSVNRSIWLLIITMLLSSPTWAQKAERVVCVISTEVGEIEIEIDLRRSPITAQNFLQYVDGRHYDGGQFHRAVKLDNQPNNKILIEVIQASINPERAKDKFPPIKLETTKQTGLSHRDGTISMARSTPDSATSDFFIVIGDQPSLDYGGLRNPDGLGTAAFGRVTKGLDVVRKIQNAPSEAQKLKPPIKILQIRRRH